MAEPKSFASLSSTLLARKGAAKPAMRPQGWGQGVNLEDLGWNDMGHGQSAPASVDERPEHVPSSIAALTPAPRLQPVEPEAAPVLVPTPPPVVEQQRTIAETFAKPVEVAPAPAAPTPPAPVAVAPVPVAEPIKPVRSTAEVVAIASRQRRAPGGKAKAAFTLRLDADRHLKLRLACAVSHRSAQQLVTEALDTFLASLPELDAMAGHVPASAGKRS